MQNLAHRVASALSLASVAFTTLALAPQVALADPANPKSPADCRAIADFTERGLCWDALDREGLHDQKIVKKRNFGLDAKPPADAAVKPKPEKAKAKKRVVPESEDVNNLTLTIASVRDTALGRVLLTSTDGAVWEQTDADRVADVPGAGESFKVSKTALGGYMCHITRWESVRCQRDE
jgi:hypothetical protein